MSLLSKFIITYYLNTSIFRDILEIFTFSMYFAFSPIKILMTPYSTNIDLLYSFKDSTELLKKSAKNSEINLSNRCKCKIYWVFLENNKNNYKNYNAFEQLWDTNKNLKKEFYSKINIELDDLKRTWKIQKRTLMWFLGKR